MIPFVMAFFIESVWACVPVARTFDIQNSPFSVARMQLSPSTLRLILREGQEVDFSCTQSGGEQQWQIARLGDDPSTADRDESDMDPRTPGIQPVANVLMSQVGQIRDNDGQTLLTHTAQGAEGQMMIHLEGGLGPQIVFRCQQRDDGYLAIHVDFVDGNRKVQRTLSYTREVGPNGVSRGLGASLLQNSAGSTPQASGSVDFNQLAAGPSLSFEGCQGGPGTPISPGGGTRAGN